MNIKKFLVAGLLAISLFGCGALVIHCSSNQQSTPDKRIENDKNIEQLCQNLNELCNHEDMILFKNNISKIPLSVLEKTIFKLTQIENYLFLSLPFEATIKPPLSSHLTELHEFIATIENEIKERKIFSDASLLDESPLNTDFIKYVKEAFTCIKSLEETNEPTKEDELEAQFSISLSFIEKNISQVSKTSLDKRNYIEECAAASMPRQVSTQKEKGSAKKFNAIITLLNQELAVRRQQANA